MDIGGPMTLKNYLRRRKLNKHKLQELSHLAYPTIRNLFDEDQYLGHCSIMVVHDLAKALDITIESLLEIANVKEIHRPDFEIHKGNYKHALLSKGDLDFIEYIITSDIITIYLDQRWYMESLYILGMLDYLSRINEIPLYNKYDYLRDRKLSMIIYPADVILISYLDKKSNIKKECFEKSFPEFKRFNIVETDLRNVI